MTPDLSTRWKVREKKMCEDNKWDEQNNIYIYIYSHSLNRCADVHMYVVLLPYPQDDGHGVALSNRLAITALPCTISLCVVVIVRDYRAYTYVVSP